MYDEKDWSIPSDEDGDALTGPLPYTLMNDYMFKAFLQRNQRALRGLLCALLGLKDEDISSVVLQNPIELGATTDAKMMILDIKVILNNSHIINLEMQVEDFNNWDSRSLMYLCRTFDQLEVGDDYGEALSVIHVGILNFTPKGFPEKLFTKYNFINKDTGHVYSERVTIYVLQLNQLGNPEDEMNMADVYYWAQLFRATTWEEICMLAQKHGDADDFVFTLKELTADEKIQMQCEGRRRYYSDLAAAIRKGEMLSQEKIEEKSKEIAEKVRLIEEKDNEIIEKDKVIEKLDNEIAEKDRLIEERNQSITEKDNEIAEKDRLIEERNQSITEKDNKIAEKDNKIAEKDNKIAEKDNEITEKDRIIAELQKKLAAVTSDK